MPSGETVHYGVRVRVRVDVPSEMDMTVTSVVPPPISKTLTCFSPRVRVTVKVLFLISKTLTCFSPTTTQSQA